MLVHFCPLIVQVAQMGLILPRWGLIFQEYHPQSLFFTQPSHTPVGDIYIHKTPPTPGTPSQILDQKTPFPGLNLKVGKMNYSLDNLDPKWAKYLKSGQHFSRSGQKQLFMIMPHRYKLSLLGKHVNHRLTKGWGTGS